MQLFLQCVYVIVSMICACECDHFKVKLPFDISGVYCVNGVIHTLSEAGQQDGADIRRVIFGG